MNKAKNRSSHMAEVPLPKRTTQPSFPLPLLLVTELLVTQDSSVVRCLGWRIFKSFLGH